MHTMRAISQDVLGGPEVLKEVRLDRPEPRPNEVLGVGPAPGRRTAF